MSIAGPTALWLSRTHKWLNTDRNALYAIGTLGAGALLVLYIARRPKRLGKRLPGPLLPTAFENGGVLDIKFMEQAQKKYGPTFGVSVLGFNTVFLCDLDSIKEAFVQQGDKFSGRMHMPFLSYVNKDCGVIFIDGPKWQEHRRFVLSILRTFGFGKNITERIIQDELAVLHEEMDKIAGTPVFPRVQIVKSVANVICLLVFGERCAAEEDFELMIRVTNDSITAPANSSFVAILFYRLFLLLPGDLFGIKKFLADVEKMKVYMEAKIANHRETIDWNNERDLIDAYLVEMRKREQQSPGQHTFTDFQLFRVVFELFIAGMETTSTTLTWAVMLMAKYPEVQTRVQQELDSVIGDSRIPQVADRNRLVYTTAVMHEIERLTCILPLAIAHRLTEDTTLRGYHVPGDSVVVSYIVGAHRDPRVWKNPQQFDPSNFYDESTKSLINLQSLIPFGVGKRACLGESLATQELFVFFAGLLQRYRFEADPSHPLPQHSDDSILLPARLCPEYKVIIRQRTGA